MLYGMDDDENDYGYSENPNQFRLVTTKKINMKRVGISIAIVIALIAIIILGVVASKNISKNKTEEVAVTEESGNTIPETDSRIVAQIIFDSYEKNCDIAIIVSADSDMIPAIEIAKSIGQKVFIYFPPNHYSSNLSSIANGQPVFLSRFESRFRQSLLPDIVHLTNEDFDLHIPEKWASYRK